MHDVLRARLVRTVESLPADQVYQVLDYIEFLQSKYGSEEVRRRAGTFQRLAEGIEDGLRSRSVDPSTLREAFQVLASADRAFNGLAKAGRRLMEELRGSETAPGGRDAPSAAEPAEPREDARPEAARGDI